MRHGRAGQGAKQRGHVYKLFAGCKKHPMIELLRINDPVLLSFVEALLADAGITHLVADRNMSILEGSLGVLPRRVLVAEADAETARQLLRDAGIGNELRDA